MSKGNNQYYQASPGGFAITVFLGSTLYLVLLNHGWQTLLSFKAVVFLLLGIFFTVLFIGVPFQLMSNWIGINMSRIVDNREASTRVKLGKIVTTVMMTAQVITTYYACKLCFSLYFS